MNDFNAKDAANEVLNDGFTPEELGQLKNPNYLEPGDYVFVIKGFKVFEPNPEKNQNGACYYDLEVVRPLQGMPLDYYPKQSLKFYDINKESSGLWLKVCPEYIKSIKPGTSRAQALELARSSCVNAQVLGRVSDYVWNGEERQKIKIFSVYQD